MPDYKKLDPGDRVKIISIPELDMEQYRSESKSGNKDFLCLDTIRVLQYLIDKNKICIIRDVDEYGHPWFEFQFRNENDHGYMEYHSLNITDDDSWEYVR